VGIMGFRDISEDFLDVTTCVQRYGLAGIAEPQASRGARLGPYVDYLEAEDADSFVALATHAGINLRGDPIKQILRHYYLGRGQYDIERCADYWVH
jgi:hypothetical protein